MARFSAKPMDKADFTIIGRTWGSNLVAREAEGVSALWKRDVVPLTDYGHGLPELESFDAVRNQHAKLMTTRPDSVATKRTVVAAKSAGFRKAATWLDQSECLLKQVAKNDAAFLMRVYEAMPNKDFDELPEHLGTLKLLLTDAKKLAPQNGTIDARLAEADAILEAVKAAPSNVLLANETKVADTAELDYLDGQLIVAMRALNEAGTRAIRNGTLNARYSDYRFKHLRRSTSSPAQDEPITPPPAEENPTA